MEEREDAGTPPIVQKIRAALAFWVKEYMGYHLIDTQENLWLDCAFRRLLPNPNIQVLGNTSVKRHPIISFLINSISLDQAIDEEKQAYIWRERVTKKDKPLHGRFVTKLLNDLFGIQARGGCACAGPYGHILLNVDKEQSLAFRSAIQKVKQGNFSSIFLDWISSCLEVCVNICETKVACRGAIGGLTNKDIFFFPKNNVYLRIIENKA